MAPLHQFQLAIKPQPNASSVLTILQRPFPAFRHEQALPFIEMGSIDGLALLSARDIVLDALRTNHHRPAALEHARSSCLALSEESGILLTLLFKAIGSLANPDHICALQHAILAMSSEEAYYWFAKCTGPDGRRGVHALRILCGGTR